MSDVDGGAPAPVDSAPAPEVVETPAPIRDDPIAPEPAEPDDKPKAPVSTEEALKKAFDKVEAKSKAAEKDDKPVDKPKPAEDKGPTRSEDGKFAAKEGTEKPVETVDAKPATPEPPKPAKAAYEAPARFDEEAKAAWRAAPEPVQREVDRAFRELTQGMEKHKAEYEPIRPFAEMAKQSGTKLETAIASYVQTEQLLRSNPIKGLESICENLGLSLKQVAEHVLNQPADQQQNAKDVEIAQLRQTVQRLEHGFTSFKGDLESREVQQTIHAFKADPKHTRFDELQPDIGMFLQTGRANNLSEAYEMAARLNPAPQAPAPAASYAAPNTDPEAQTLKGSKSIHGSPTPGSDPTQRKPSKSIEDSIRLAMAQVG